MESLKSTDSTTTRGGQMAKNQRIITHLPAIIAGITR